VLLTLAVALWNSGCGCAPPDNNEKTPTPGDYWVNVSVDGFSLSFWGFVSNDAREDFSNPIARQNDLDPVNFIFWVDGAGSALDKATQALEAMDWTQNDPCWGVPPQAASLLASPLFGWLPWWSPLYASFQVSASQPSHARGRDLRYPFNGCQNEYHIRLFEPYEDSPWAIGAAHHDYCLGGPISGCMSSHKTVDWDVPELGPEKGLGQHLDESGRILNTDVVYLGNTTDNGTWRGLPNDGWATVVRLPGK
jgi:hypothetical protein